MTDHTDIGQRLEKDKWHITAVDAEDAIAEITRLRAELAAVNNEFGSQTTDWPEAWKRVAEIKDISQQRWVECERLRAEAEALRNLAAEERDQCAMTVWMTLQEATADDADDMGLDGWMREAERRIRDRAIDATKGTT